MNKPSPDIARLELILYLLRQGKSQEAAQYLRTSAKAADDTWPLPLDPIEARFHIMRAQLQRIRSAVCDAEDELIKLHRDTRQRCLEALDDGPDDEDDADDDDFAFSEFEAADDSEFDDEEDFDTREVLARVRARFHARRARASDEMLDDYEFESTHDSEFDNEEDEFAEFDDELEDTLDDAGEEEGAEEDEFLAQPKTKIVRSRGKKG